VTGESTTSARPVIDEGRRVAASCWRGADESGRGGRAWFIHAWMDYLLGLLNLGGHLVFTTSGRFHIDWLTNIDQHMNGQHEVLKSYFAELKAMAPPDQIKQRYDNGEFQFYRAGGGVLAPTFYGEAIIPRSYIEQHFRSTFVDFRDDIEE
jgi:hypothetical protein